jgi:hypothetical protein
MAEHDIPTRPDDSVILAKLKTIEADERLYYRPATVFENAPLALIQSELETWCAALRWVLGMPRKPYGPKAKRDE